MDEELSRIARDQGISKAEAVRRAITGCANLRRIVSPDKELILRQRGPPEQKRQGIVL